MALFGSKKDEAPKKAVKKSTPAPKKVSSKKGTVKSSSLSVNEVLISPRIAEKSAHLTAQRVYTFNISVRANKGDVAKAIYSVYKVRPTKIRVVKNVGKKVRLRTRRGEGTKPASKKAYVYLKEGDRIEFSS